MTKPNDLRDARKQREAADQAQQMEMPVPAETTHRNVGYDVQEVEGGRVLIIVEKGIPGHVHYYPMGEEAANDMGGKLTSARVETASPEEAASIIAAAAAASK